MKECQKCKTILEDDELFCHECGTKQEIEEVATQNEDMAVPSGKCIHCGETIEGDSVFCPYCGKSQVMEDVKEPEHEVENEPVSKEKSEPKQEYNPELEEKEEPQEALVQEKLEEQTTYEWGEEKKSKKWIWLLLAVLLIGAGAWFFFSQNSNSFDSNDTMPETVDTDSIEEPDEIDEYEETTPTSPLAFLEQFYKGDIKDEYYISQNVTANVLNKLKRDYEYECPSDDCLATWVFTAYPPGSDLYLEEGPIITESKEEGKYSVYYSYYIQGQSGRIYKPRGILVSVTQIDGKYLISDYELVMPDIEQNQDNMPDNNEEYESQKMDTGEDMHTTQANSTQEKQQHSAFFVYGTATELKEFDILDDDGRLRPNFNNVFFTKIDTRIDKEIKLYSKSAKILTTHPSNSYTLKTNEHNQYELSIIDPQRFWSSSMYLVILVK